MGVVTYAHPTGLPRRITQGDVEKTYKDITMNTSYTTGGDDASGLAAVCGFNRIFKAIPVSDTSGYILQYDYVNDTIVAYEAGTASANLDEVDSGDNLSSLVGAVRWEIEGV